MSTIEDTISQEDARCFYDRLGTGYDFGRRFERRAKQRGLALLDLAPGQQVLNVGVGTGHEHAVIQQRIYPGAAVGIDIARTMLDLTRVRLSVLGSIPLCEATARHLPFADNVFDRAFSSYVFDLLPAGQFNPALSEIRRVLKSGGHFVNVSLTEGVSLSSRLLMEAWKNVYHISPVTLGGCRPIRLTYPLLKAGFSRVEREVVVQLGVPSEVTVAHI